MYNFELLRIKKIAGILYSNVSEQSLNNDTVVIYGPGAPIPPDNGNLPDAKHILSYQTDLFVPDYIGYGRSDGICTPQGCIQTFLDLYHEFMAGTTAINHYSRKKRILKYKRIIFMGRSFGGSYIPLLPRFEKKISELCLIYPAVNNKACGSIQGEESNEDFMRGMKKDGYHYLYRGITSPIWLKHLNNEDGLAPVDNVKYLDNTKIFIGHGINDQCIDYSQSASFHKQLITTHPQSKSNFKLILYKEAGHDYRTSNQAAYDSLQWFNLAKVKTTKEV